jgi:hypothetical protein
MAKEQAATIRRLHKLLTQHGLTGQIRLSGTPDAFQLHSLCEDFRPSWLSPSGAQQSVRCVPFWTDRDVYSPFNARIARL